MGAAYLAAVVISNLPEAPSSTTGLARGGWKNSRILWMWIGIAFVSGIASLAGYGLFQASSPETVGFILANAELLSSEPDLGEFVVGVEVGSREGFSPRYTIRVSLGQFNIDTGAYDDALSVQVIEGLERGIRVKSMKVSPVGAAEITRALAGYLTADPYAHKKDKAIEFVAGALNTTAPKVRSAWKRAEERGHLVSESRPVREGSRTVTRSVWAWVGGEGP